MTLSVPSPYRMGPMNRGLNYHPYDRIENCIEQWCSTIDKSCDIQPMITQYKDNVFSDDATTFPVKIFQNQLMFVGYVWTVNWNLATEIQRSGERLILPHDQYKSP
jgi:hypothetical protein